jgi:hypothetical protein
MTGFAHQVGGGGQGEEQKKKGKATFSRTFNSNQSPQ